MLKYYLISKIAFLNYCNKKTEIIVKTIVYFFIVFLYKQIIQISNNNVDNFYYIMATQLIIFSSSNPAFDIAKDIKTNKIKYFLLQPANYMTIKFVENTTISVIRFTILSVIFFAITKHNPFYLFSGVMLYNLIGIFIGLLAYYVNDIKQ